MEYDEDDEEEDGDSVQQLNKTGGADDETIRTKSPKSTSNGNTRSQSSDCFFDIATAAIPEVMAQHPKFFQN